MECLVLYTAVFCIQCQKDGTYPILCVDMFVYVCRTMCVHVCIEARDWCWVFSSISLHPVFNDLKSDLVPDSFKQIHDAFWLLSLSTPSLFLSILASPRLLPTSVPFPRFSSHELLVSFCVPFSLTRAVHVSIGLVLSTRDRWRHHQWLHN